MSRIIGQCNTADFRSIEHLACTLTGDGPEQLDADSLSKKQKFALVVIASFREAGIKFKELYKVREILFWDSGHLEWRFHNTPGAKELLFKLNRPDVKADMVRGIRNLFDIPLGR